MKRKTDDLNQAEIRATLDALYTAASAVKGRDAVKSFLRDLLTQSERIMLGRRIIIARLLIGGETYERIQERMGVGKTTIGRVHHWLKDQLPGFEEAVAGMEREFASRAAKKLYATSTLYRYKKKYPLHFLLFPAPKAEHKELYPSRIQKKK